MYAIFIIIVITKFADMCMIEIEKCVCNQEIDYIHMSCLEKSKEINVFHFDKIILENPMGYSIKLKIQNKEYTDFNNVVNNFTQNLLHLEMTYNKITYIRKNLFQNVINLLTFDLSSNEIEQIEASCFNNLSNLKEANFSENKIKYIQKGIFNNLSSLENLNLFNNQIENKK